MSTEDVIRNALRSFFKRCGVPYPEVVTFELLDHPDSPLNNGDFILALADRHASRLGTEWPQPEPVDEVARLRAALLSVTRVFQDVDYWEYVTDDAADLCDALMAEARAGDVGGADL